MAKRTYLKDLLDAGLLRVGEDLVCEPRRGEVYKAVLQDNGNIRFEGKQYNLNGFVGYVAGGARNGWRDVKARGQSLDQFRKLLSDESKSGALVSAATELPFTQEPEPRFEPQPDVVYGSGVSSQEDQQSNMKARLLARLQSVTPSQFEHLVAAYLRAKGIREVQVTGSPNDGGIDAVGEVSFLSIKVAVQAKRYASGSNVGIEPVQRLRGSMAYGFDRGIFITTSDFTPAARGWVEETGAPITLVDGGELVSQMVELGLGVKTIPVVETQIDEGFFEGLGF